MTRQAIPQRRPKPLAGRVAFFATLGLSLATVLPALIVFAWPSNIDDPALVRFTILAEDVPALGDAPVRVPDGRFWLVNLLPEEGAHGLHGALGHGALVALPWKDPHRGCTVPWRSDFVFEGKHGWFRNPCHGETYIKAGVRVFGPQTRSLDTFAVTVGDNDNVIVNLTAVTPGADDNSTRAVPYLAN